jgi:hypothetical protein
MMMKHVKVKRMKPFDYQKEILARGWDAESKGDGFQVVYQASQGGFRSPWLDSWEAVFNWINTEKGKR